ncbi:transcriptional regulator [Aeromonas veronii]
MKYHVDVENKWMMLGDINLPLEGLSNTELIILKTLSDAFPDAISREQLIESGWKNKVVSDTSLNVAINSIRKNISGNNGFNGEEIVLTERGFGYKLNRKFPFENTNPPNSHLQCDASINGIDQNYIEDITPNKKNTDTYPLTGNTKKGKISFGVSFLIAINISAFIFLLYIITLLIEVYSL